MVTMLHDKQDRVKKGVEHDLGMEEAREGPSHFLMRSHLGRSSEVREQVIQKSG